MLRACQAKYKNTVQYTVFELVWMRENLPQGSLLRGRARGGDLEAGGDSDGSKQAMRRMRGRAGRQMLKG